MSYIRRAKLMERIERDSIDMSKYDLDKLSDEKIVIILSCKNKGLDDSKLNAHEYTVTKMRSVMLIMSSERYQGYKTDAERNQMIQEQICYR